MPSTPGVVTLATRDRTPRLDRIEELLLSDDPPITRELVALIQREFRTPRGTPPCERVIYRDIAEVWYRVRKRHEDERTTLIARARVRWERRERLADMRGDTQAGNFALDRWTRLHGLYAPTRVEVSGAAAVSVDIQVRGIVGVLSERGLAALQVLQEEIERARMEGRLPELDAGDDPADAPSDEAVEHVAESAAIAAPSIAAPKPGSLRATTTKLGKKT